MKLYTLISFLILFNFSATAQSSIAKIEYSYAEEAYRAKNYEKTIEHLEEVKSLLGGETNGLVMYLEIMSRNHQRVALYQTLQQSAGTNSNASSNKNLIRMANRQKQIAKEQQMLSNNAVLVGAIGIVQNIQKTQTLKSSKKEKSAATILKKVEIDTIEKWLASNKKLDDMSSVYLKSFENDVPLEKLKQIYEIKKEVRPFIENNDLITEAWTLMAAQKHELAYTKFTELNAKGVNSLTVLRNLKPIIEQNKANAAALKIKEETIRSIEENMVLIKGNTSVSESIDPDGNTVLKSIPDLYVSKFELTRVNYWSLINLNKLGYTRDKTHPVNFSERNTVAYYIAILNNLSGKKYRLPTKEEWFWFATGGRKTTDEKRGFNEEKADNLDKYAWFNKNSNDRSQKVGLKQPNELGLYDIWGNVSEFTTTNAVGGAFNTLKKHFNSGDEYTDLYKVNNEEKSLGKRKVFDLSIIGVGANKDDKKLGIRLVRDVE